ncbi:MAG TPA: hypothetical protein VMU84_10675, partial [Thermoanaerobaculia bacterium]|nr:hypothetical protein [Thermoanaerobaculia bacterium]
DREPEPGAARGAGAIGAEEPFEQARQLGLLDPDPVVRPAQHDRAVLALDRERERRAGAGIPDRVGRQVLCDHPDHPRAHRELDGGVALDDERHAGAASGINNAIARAAGLLAVAIFGSLAISIFARELDRRVPPQYRDAMHAQAIRLAEAEAPKNADPQAKKAIEEAVRQSFVRSFRINALASGALAASAALGAMFIPRRRQNA